MINLDFSLAVAIYVSLSICAVILAWLLKKGGKQRGLNLDPKFIWFCSICTYTYINTRQENISTCPRCGSYNKK